MRIRIKIGSLAFAMMVAIVPVAPAQDMSMSKSGPSSAAPNTDVSYTITATNLGPSAATNVSFTDTLPSGSPPSQMTFVSFMQTSGPAFNCGVPSTTTTCTIASLAAGVTATFTFTGHIPNGTASGTTYTNTVTVTSTGDPTPGNNTSSTTLIVQTADVGVTKSGPATAIAGGPTFDYIVTLSNAGPDAASAASFTDTLPAGLTFVSVVQNTGPSASCSGGGTVTCTISTLANGASAQFTITVQPLPSIANGTIVNNTVTATTSSADPNSSNNSSTASTTISAQADVSITKSGPATATAGNNISYTITVNNGGPSNAANVTWTDALPASTTFVSETQNTGPAFTCTTGATVSCNIASLAPAATATFTLVVRVGANVANGTTLSNTATASSTTPDSNPGNNSSTASTTISAQADVAVTKSGPATIVAGNNITYNVSVMNNGPSDAQSVSLSDPLPANTTFVSETQNTGPAFSCTNPAVGASGTVSCTTSTLAAGATATFTLIFNVGIAAPGGSTITNTASASSTTTDPVPTNNSASASATVSGGNVDLSIAKTPSPPPYGTGLPITYTIVVSNAGPAPAIGTVVTDTIPAGTTFVSATPTQGTCSGTSTVTCALGTIASGASASISLVLNLPATPGSVSNTASVTSSNPDTNAANNSSTATVTVISAAQIPALGPFALLLLAAMIALIGLMRLQS